MKIWYCATCGYEVGSRGRCHRCRQKLVAAPLPALEAGEEDAEVGYRLDGWADRTRGRLIEALAAERVAHRFEDDELVVGVGDEERTDALVSEVGEGAADDEVAEDEWEELPVGDGDGADAVGAPFVAAGDGAPGAPELHTLWRAAARLRLDPTDMEADGEVAEVSATVFLLDEGPGTDPETWAAIGRVTRRLLAALGAEEALDDEIRREAAVLATLLGPVVGEGPPATNGAAGRAVPAEPAGATVPDPADDADDADNAADDDAAEDAGGDRPGDGGGEVPDEEGPRILGAGPETSYEVPEWLPDQRALLTVLLEERAIPHAWDGADLVVPSADEEEVESLFDRVGGGADSDEDDEARYHQLEELFAAVTRLAGDPDDDERRAAVLGATGAVEGPVPLGFVDGQWLDLRRRTRGLADSLEHGGQAEVIAGQAVALRDLLRSLV